MALPTITHAWCWIEIHIMCNHISANVAAGLRDLNPDPEIDVSWISTEAVSTFIANELNGWSQTDELEAGFPRQHAASWSRAINI